MIMSQHCEQGKGRVGEGEQDGGGERKESAGGITGREEKEGRREGLEERLTSCLGSVSTIIVPGFDC